MFTSNLILGYIVGVHICLWKMQADSTQFATQSCKCFNERAIHTQMQEPTLAERTGGEWCIIQVQYMYNLWK